MSKTHRLQVSISKGLHARLSMAADRERMSQAEWVRQAIEHALRASGERADLVGALSALGAPTGDIDKMIAELEKGRALGTRRSRRRKNW